MTRAPWCPGPNLSTGLAESLREIPGFLYDLSKSLLAARALQPFVILLSLEAKFVDELGVGLEALRESDGERLRVNLRIVNGQLDLHRAEVGTPELLGHLRDVAHRAAPRVDPRVVAESSALDDERVAFPTAHRIA